MAARIGRHLYNGEACFYSRIIFFVGMPLITSVDNRRREFPCKFTDHVLITLIQIFNYKTSHSKLNGKISQGKYRYVPKIHLSVICYNYRSP